MNLKSKIRAAVRHLILSTLGQFAKPQPSVHIFCMHKIKNVTESPETFREKLKYLSTVGKLVHVEEAVRLVENRVPATFIEKMKTPVVFDGRNCFSVPAMQNAGIKYFSIGR